MPVSLLHTAQSLLPVSAETEGHIKGQKVKQVQELRKNGLTLGLAVYVGKNFTTA